jgi:hypothetical protein
MTFLYGMTALYFAWIGIWMIFPYTFPPPKFPPSPVVHF